MKSTSTVLHLNTLSREHHVIPINSTSYSYEPPSYR